jgi:hypothetical protein
MFSLELLPFTVAISCMSPGSVRVLPTVTTAASVAAVIVVLEPPENLGRPFRAPIGGQTIVTKTDVFSQTVFTLYNMLKGAWFRGWVSRRFGGLVPWMSNS